MTLLSLHNQAVIEAFVRQNPFVHLLEMGDLDEFFWDHTIWYALQDRGTFASWHSYTRQETYPYSSPIPSRRES